MGLFDKNNKGLFGGLFDFNGDGKTTWDEEYLAFKIFEECTKKEESDYDSDLDSDLLSDTVLSDKYDWRLYCEDGFSYDVDPEDYEAEEEYEEALNEAKYGWRDNCESISDTGIDPEDYETEEEYDEALVQAQERTNSIGITMNFSVDCPALDKLDEIKEENYPNKRRYNAAYTLADEFLIYSSDEYEKSEKDRCRFIMDKADAILAANYLTPDGSFLYSQAIKDNFSLPCSLPDEDEIRELEFHEVLCKISRYDIPLSFEIWNWCLETFLPFAMYDDSCGNDLSTEVIDDLYDFPDGYKTKLIQYMSENRNFCNTVISAGDESANNMPELIAEAIKEKQTTTALVLFKSELKKAKGDWKKINTLTEEVILWCKNYDELESIEYFRDNLLPLVKEISTGMVQDEIPKWESDIAEYIDRVEDECEQYAYTRKNAWRKTVPDGKKYALNPIDYDTEQEYLEAFNEEKYGWRKWYKERDNYGLDLNSFETQEEYRNALTAKIKEARRQKQTKRSAEQQLKKQDEIQEYEKDKTIYTYCGVLLPFSSRPYFFRTEDGSIKIGDTVIVPVGEDKKEIQGKVVSVGQYSRLGVPYPVEKTKMIICKTEEETNL